MGFLDKLKFWKKEDDDGGFGDLGLGKDDLGGDPFGSGSDPFGDSGSSFPSLDGESSSPPPSPGFPSSPPLSSRPSLTSQQRPSQSQPTSYPTANFTTQQRQSNQPGFGAPGSSGGNSIQQQTYGQSYDQPDFNRPFTMNVPQTPSQSLSSGFSSSKDLEIISSKLDNLRSSLDMINQRLSNLERMYEREEVRKRTGW